ncbi:MAG: hypothetical protein QM820_05280 [Minicystis sp.]
MATRLRGWDAIRFAERNGCTLGVHAAGAEPARDGVSVDEARRLVEKEPDRVYVDFDEPDPDTGVA